MGLTTLFELLAFVCFVAAGLALWMLALLVSSVR